MAASGACSQCASCARYETHRRTVVGLYTRNHRGVTPALQEGDMILAMSAQPDFTAHCCPLPWCGHPWVPLPRLTFGIGARRSSRCYTHTRNICGDRARRPHRQSELSIFCRATTACSHHASMRSHLCWSINNEDDGRHTTWHGWQQRGDRVVARAPVFASPPLAIQPECLQGSQAPQLDNTGCGTDRQVM